MFKQTSVSVGAILFVSLAACADDGGITADDEVEADGSIHVYNGVRVACLGEGQQWAGWHPILNQWIITDAARLETCIGQPNVSGADDAQFTYEEWKNPPGNFPAYHDQIAALCEHRCLYENQNLPDDSENEHGVCSASGWTDHVTSAAWVPESGMNCYTWYADEGTVADPYAETIDWSGGSAPLSLPLECSLLDDCYTEFDGDIGKWTQAWEYGGELGATLPMERGADYYATASAATMLTLDMDAGSGPDYDDAELLDGYAEYSASDCGESTCPFYLASFSASNDTDVWDVWVSLGSIFSEPKHLHNVQIDALHSSLGVWRPSTGQVAFLPGTLVFAISFDVSSDCAGCSGLGDDHYDLILRNHDVVFGEFSAGGFVLEQAFPVVGGDATLEVDLEAEEGPPSAGFDLSARVECNDATGYVLGSGDSASTDPDNDIETEMWIVDGTAMPSAPSLDVGTHEVALGVVDRRGAWDFTDERKVEVIRGSACI